MIAFNYRAIWAPWSSGTSCPGRKEHKTDIQDAGLESWVKQGRQNPLILSA